MALQKLSERDAAPGGIQAGDQIHVIRSNGDSPETFSSYRAEVDTMPPSSGITAADVEASPTGLDNTVSTDVQGVIEDFDAALTEALGYHFGFYFGGTPEAGETLARIMVVQTVVFPGNFSGSEGYVAANPGSTYAIDVKDDGASIGTASISSGGAFTFTTTSGTSKTVAAGSRLEFVAPANSPPDSSIEDISITLKGVA